MNTTEALESVFRVDLPARPYPGLRPFEKHEWPIFFGRERMTDAIVAQLIRKHLLVVHGDSGCGKSSLIRAGVLPRLEQENARGGCRWRTCATIPGEAPLWNLARTLAELDGSPAGEEQVIAFQRLLNLGRDAPAALAERLRRDDDDHVCLLIDQFEELFDHAKRHGPHEAQRLTELLVGLHADPPVGLYAIITMRSEFLGACARYRGFAETVNASQYLLPRMDHADLLRAIREPATLYGGTVSRALAERLIADSGGGQDQLPLIQHGLMRLHRERMATTGPSEAPADAAQTAGETTWSLGLDHFRYADGLAGLLSEHADAVMSDAAQAYAGSGDPDRVIEELFRALTDINADGQAIRRTRRLDELDAITEADKADLREIIDRFRADGVSFLRPYGSEPIAAQDRIDISHEALIRRWKKIADPKDGWLTREFDDGQVWRVLLAQAEGFERVPTNILAPTTTDEREDWLRLRNPAWAERYGGGWERVQRLVTASAAARDRQRAERDAAERKKSEKYKKRKKWLRIFAVLVVVFLPVSIILGYLAWKESDEAERANQTAAGKAQAAQEERVEAQRRSDELEGETRQIAEELYEVARKLERVLPHAEVGAALSERLDRLRAQIRSPTAAAQRPIESPDPTGGEPPR